MKRGSPHGSANASRSLTENIRTTSHVHQADTMTCGAGNHVAKADAGGLDAVHRSCERVRVGAE
jgi:hypothetical protein